MTKEERLEKLEDLLEDHPDRRTDLIEIGAFSYGVPTVRKYDTTTKLRIGKFCSIGSNVQIIMGGEHKVHNCTTYPFDVLVVGAPTLSKGDVIIGNDVWIGNNVTILSGVTIGDGAVIGAGSVVTKDVESYQVRGGAPAEFIKYRFGAINRARLTEIRWWDWTVDMIAEAMPMLMSDNVEALYQYWKEVVVHE